MTAELGTWAGAIGAAIHGAEAAGRARPDGASRAPGVGRRPMTTTGYQPHYRQIEQALRERIATLRPGERLPSDAELCAEFGVSRMTARNAMQRLADGRPDPARAGSRQLRGGAAGASPGEPADDVQPGDAPGRARPELAGPDPGHPAVLGGGGREPRHPGAPAGRPPAPAAPGRRSADRPRIGRPAWATARRP